MKNLILSILLLVVSVAGFGQVQIDVVSPDGVYQTHINDSGFVEITITEDKLFFESNGSVAYFTVDSVFVTVFMHQGIGEQDYEVKVHEYFISGDGLGIVTITLWGDLNLIVFEYESGKLVINSGEGLKYVL